MAVPSNILGTGSWWDAQCSHTAILGAEREMRSRCDEEGTAGSPWTVSIPPSKADSEEFARKDGGGRRSPGEPVSYSFLLTSSAPSPRSLRSRWGPLWWPLPPGPVHFKAQPGEGVVAGLLC